jgi:anti-anti-sigma factor
MKIGTSREKGSAVLHLEGRLDREGAEHLSGTLGQLLQEGVRSVSVDFSRVTYASSAGTQVLKRWRQELAVLRGKLQLTSVPEPVKEVLDAGGWDTGPEPAEGLAAQQSDLRRSTWQARADFAASGLYELSAAVPAGTLTCHVHGDPDLLSRASYGPGDCRAVGFPDDAFGLGLGAIGGHYEECHQRFGELIAMAGCIAYFPSDGTRMADYLIGGGQGGPPRAVLASGLSCEGGFSQLIRFSTRAEAEGVPLSELAATGLAAVGGKMAGMVIAGETAGLSGARILRSPGSRLAPLRFDLPAVRDWLLVSPERIHPMTTTVIAGVVARAPEGALAAHLRPLEPTGRLFGHFHAAVFSYHPLPQRTVELTALLRGIFANHELRDVLHLILDNRGAHAIRESELIRGVAWAGPITRIERATP